jgi:hypothetical protein
MQIEAGKSKERELIFHAKKIIVRITLKNFDLYLSILFQKESNPISTIK